MGAIAEEQTLLKNAAAIQRQKQIATLNADRMNVPAKKSFNFHLEHLLIGLFQAIALFFLYSIYFYEEQTLVIKQDLVTQTKLDLLIPQKKTLGIQHSWVNISLALLIYLGCCLGSYFLSDIKKHLDNVKNVKEVNNCYNKIKNSRVQLTFFIECYHKERTGGKKNSQKKVVTHTATKNVQFSQCYDLSGFIKSQIQKDFKLPFVFMDYKAKYEFLQKEQEKVLQEMYNHFVSINKRDTYQDHRQTFKFSDCEEKTQQGYLLEGNETSINILLFVASIFFLVWPVSLIIELTSIERYEVTILKKVKLAETQIGTLNFNRLVQNKEKENDEIVSDENNHEA